MSSAHLITEFKSNLTSLSLDELTNIIINPENCKGITEEQANHIRDKVSVALEVRKEDVLIVGSAQVGFSLNEKKDRDSGSIIKQRYRCFDTLSDIDIAVINSELFDSYWEEIFQLFCDANPWSNSQKFQYYFFRGWIRPDKFPNDFTRGLDWWKIFSGLSKDVTLNRRKVHGGLYKSIEFLKRYQEICINECLTELKLGAK